MGQEANAESQRLTPTGETVIQIRGADYTASYSPMKRNYHLLNLLLTLLVIGSAVVYIIVSAVAGFFINFLILPVAFMYLCYFAEVCYSDLSSYLWTFTSLEELNQNLYNIKAIPPCILFRCKCLYNGCCRWYFRVFSTNSYETVESQPDSFGRIRVIPIRKKVYTTGGRRNRRSRVICRTEVPFQYSSFCDTTPKVSKESFKHKVTRVEFVKGLSFADGATASAFGGQYLGFKHCHQHPGQYVDNWVSYSIPGIDTKMVCLVDVNRPILLHWSAYFLVSLFLLSYPYRMWIEFTTGKVQLELSKVVSINPFVSMQ